MQKLRPALASLAARLLALVVAALLTPLFNPTLSSQAQTQTTVTVSRIAQPTPGQ